MDKYTAFKKIRKKLADCLLTKKKGKGLWLGRLIIRTLFKVGNKEKIIEAMTRRKISMTGLSEVKYLNGGTSGEKDANRNEVVIILSPDIKDRITQKD